MQVGIREAKAKLSALLSRVRGGETVVLTDRGRPVARVVPIGEEETLSDRLATLERRGWLGRAPSKGRALSAAVEVDEPELAQRCLREDRDAE